MKSSPRTTAVFPTISSASRGRSGKSIAFTPSVRPTRLIPSSLRSLGSSAAPQALSPRRWPVALPPRPPALCRRGNLARRPDTRALVLAPADHHGQQCRRGPLRPGQMPDVPHSGDRRLCSKGRTHPRRLADPRLWRDVSPVRHRSARPCSGDDRRGRRKPPGLTRSPPPKPGSERPFHPPLSRSIT